MNRSYNDGIIEHEGTVQRCGSNSVTVSISSETACSGCHAKNSCSFSGSSEKLIEVPGHFNLVAGDNVTVIMRKSMGFRAVFLGYVIPFILLTLALVILNSYTGSELMAGVGSVSITGFYYLILYFFRNSIKNIFTFTIKDF